MFYRILSIVFVVILVFSLFVPMALAQDPAPTAEPTPAFDWPVELPETAQEGLKVIESFLVFVSALVTMYVTSWLRKLPLLSEDEKSKIVGLAADMVAGLFGAIIFVVLAYGAYLAKFLDSNGMWAVLQWIFAVWPTTWVMHKGLKFSKTGNQ